jgi:predicted amidophosphoribosyltransferase
MENGSCPNWLCKDPARRIRRIQAIAYSSGELRETILRYKYKNKTGWSLIFGRLLVAWLDQNSRGCPPDLIIANPTYVGSDGAKFGHTERGYAAGKLAAATEQRTALDIPDTTRTRGRRILVYDDVCTTESQLDIIRIPHG